MPLRIGTLFVILVTSAIGVFAPILLSKLPFAAVNAWISVVIKQFGTGIIIATAFVHVSVTPTGYAAQQLTAFSYTHMPT